jgi:8-oxo-dGTP diphosphatase
MTTSEERFKVIPYVYALFFREGKVLLSRRYNTGFKDGQYSVPGGHVEKNETAKDGLCREMKEELGVDLACEDVALEHVMYRLQDEQERIDFFFIIKKWNIEPQNKELEKCDDLAWFSADELPDNTVDYVQVALNRCRENETYSEFGWEERK